MIVQEYQIRLLPAGAAQRLASIARLSHNFEPRVLREQRYQTAPEKGMVVHHQKSGRIHRILMRQS